MIVPGKKIAYVHIRKTGGTAIESYFGVCPAAVGITPYYDQENNRHYLWGGRYTHLGIREIRKARDITGYRVFSVVRNPYARIVSEAAWQDDKWHRKELLSVDGFRDYAKRDDTLKCQFPFVDDTVKIFKLEDGLGRVLEWLGEAGRIERRMRSVHYPWREYYDQWIASLVYDRFEKDFNEFGYGKNSWRHLDGNESPAIR